MLQTTSPFEQGLFDRITGKIGSTLKEIFSGDFLVNDLMKFDETSAEISRKILQGKDAAFGIRQAFAEANELVVQMGGNLEKVAQIQADVLSATQRNLLVGDKEFYEKIYAASEVTGQSARELLSVYKDIGVSTYDSTENVQKGVNMAREMGVNVNSVFDKITANLSKINEYNFQNGVEGFSKMAAKATALRVDMGTTFGFAEKVLNPEGAIEMANAFQRLGVGTSQLLDPLRLMDLSMNDPEELQNQLAKMTEQFTKFNSETGRFEILPGAKRMLRELSKDTGISYQELTKMSLASAELSDKLSKIQFPEFANKEQQEMIANLSEMKGGQYVVQIQEKDEKGGIITKEKAISELKPEDMQKLIDSNKGEDMVELTKQSMSYQEQMASSLKLIQASLSGGVASSMEGEKVMRTIGMSARNLTESGNDSLINVKNVKNNVEALSVTLAKIMSGDESLIGALTGLKGHLLNETLPAIGEFVDNLKEKMKKDKDAIYMNEGLVGAFFKMMQTSFSEFKTILPTTTTTTPQPRQDLIVTKEGTFEPSKDDVIAAFKQGGIISETMKGPIQNTNQPEINLTPLTELMSKLIDNNKNIQQPQNNNSNNEMTVKFEPLELKITADGNMEQLKIELQRNPEIGQLITRNIQKILTDSFKSELSVKNYSAKPQSIA